MTDESKSEDQRIAEAFAEMAGFTPPQEDIDRIRVYHIEQHERAQELYESAVADGVNFAITDESGDTFINTKWLGMVTRTIVEGVLIRGEEVDPLVMTTAEVLGQTIMAGDKFVGKDMA